MSPAFIWLNCLNFFVILFSNFLRIPESSTWSFIQIISQFSWRKKIGIVLSLQNKMLRFVESSYWSRNYFSAVSDLPKAIDHLEIMEIMEDWRTSFPQNSSKTRGPNFTAPARACLTTDGGVLVRRWWSCDEWRWSGYLMWPIALMMYSVWRTLAFGALFGRQNHLFIHDKHRRLDFPAFRMF